MRYFYPCLFNKRFLLLSLLTLLLGAVPSYGDPYFEDFTGAKGNMYLTALPEGWDVIGSVSAFEYDRDKYRSKSVAISINGNTQNYLVTPVVSGNVQFWLRNYTKNYAAMAMVYVCTEQNGVLTPGAMVGTTATIAKGGTTWQSFKYSVSSPTRLAIMLQSGVIDDFYADELGGSSGQGSGEQPEVTPIKKLTVEAFERLSDYEVVANEQNQYTVSFSIQVKNVGNVKLGADEVSVSVTDINGTPYATATATGDSLCVDSVVMVPVELTTSAGEGGYVAFYARENVSNTYMLNNFGTKQTANIHVTGYYAHFAILDPNGYTLLSGENIDFGVNNTAVSKTVTIKNDGTAPLAVSSVSLPEGFSASASAFTVEAGKDYRLILTLAPQAGSYGQKGGEVTITHQLGTFQFAVSGQTVDPSVYFVNFEDGQLPESWTAGDKWTVSSRSGNHYAQQGSNVEATALTTQKLMVAEGEQLSLQAMRAYSYTAATLVVSYSPDGEQWTEAGSYPLTSQFETYVITTIPAGSYYLRFEGQYVAIDNVLGFHEALDQPVLSVTDANGKTLENGAVLDFGTVAGDSTLTYYIKNVGTGVLKAELSVGEGFTVSPASVELNGSEQQAVALMLIAQPWGEKSGELKIGEGYALALQGLSRNPDVLFVDFQNQQWPGGWVAEGKWSVTHETYSSPDYYAEQFSYEGIPSAFYTQKLKVADGDMLTFLARKVSENYASSLTVYYSADRDNWTEALVCDNLTTSFASYQLNNPGNSLLPVGEYYLKFVGLNVAVDNIEGFSPVSGDHVVTLAATVPAEAVVNHLYTATAIIRNLVADGESVSVSFVLGSESQLTETFTLQSGEERKVEWSFTPHAPQEQPIEAYFVMTYTGKTVKSGTDALTIVPESGDHLTLSGTVTDNHEQPAALAGVEIVLTAGDIVYTATTDEEGHYSIDVYQTSPIYTLVAQKEGYETCTHQNVIFVNDDKTLDLMLVDPTLTAVSTVRRAVNDGTAFNLRGQCVSRQAKGLQVVGGRKVLRK